MATGNGKLKDQIYQRLCRSKAAVFSGDIEDPSDLVLALCGARLPVTGGEFLEILVELAHEGRMVVWREGGVYGFLALRAECEAMRLGSEDIAYLKDSIMEIIAGIVVSPNSSIPKDTRRTVIKI